jgi:hypothetical protein
MSMSFLEYVENRVSQDIDYVALAEAVNRCYHEKGEVTPEDLQEAWKDLLTSQGRQRLMRGGLNLAGSLAYQLPKNLAMKGLSGVLSKEPWQKSWKAAQTGYHATAANQFMGAAKSAAEAAAALDPSKAGKAFAGMGPERTKYIAAAKEKLQKALDNLTAMEKAPAEAPAPAGAPMPPPAGAPAAR